MEVLVINSGSSSLKYQLIATKDKSVLAKGAFERIGDTGAFYSHANKTHSIGDVAFKCASHSQAVAKMFSLLTDSQLGAVKDLREIKAIGHRVVHGGENFHKATLVTKDVINEVNQLASLAPLHNPANLLGVSECMKLLPGIPNVLVFDTSFHSTMAKSAYLYGLPLTDYTKHKIRRYGFHGTSHSYVASEAAKMAGVPISKLKIITCHIGNGCSIAAIDGGKSVDTSMGMTPLEGLIMGTRSGDIDPAIVEHLCKVHNFSVSDCINYLNKKSGIAGISGTGGDMRDLMDKRKTDPSAQLAIDCFIHRLVKYIGGYIGILGGVDVIVWTGGVGNNNEYIREQVLNKFKFLGIQFDKVKNNKLNGSSSVKNTTMDITASGSCVKIFIINTNEELEIALETEKIIAPRQA